MVGSNVVAQYNKTTLYCHFQAGLDDQQLSRLIGINLHEPGGTENNSNVNTKESSPPSSTQPSTSTSTSNKSKSNW